MGLPRALAAIALVAGCGDNFHREGAALDVARDVVIVAHQDDDLMFMQPDLSEAVRAGDGVVIVYVTAGNANEGVRYANDRIDGLRYAYSYTTGKTDWDCGWIDIAGHAAQHCRLDSASLSLVFLAYPDGGKQGQLDHSLLRLWQGDIDGANTIAANSTHYDRAGLITTVAEIVTTTRPSTVRTLEIGATHGRDNVDHFLVGALTVLAMTTAGSDAELIAYRGYSVELEPANQVDAVFEDVARAARFYDACTNSCGALNGSCGEPCDTLPHTRDVWLHRRYAVAMRRPASGVLQFGERCLDANALLGECDTAPRWEYRGRDLILDGDHCLRLAPDGNAILASCATPSPGWFFDDEGHLWIGVLPAPSADMAFAHVPCLDAGDRVHATTCGADHAPSWQLVRPLVITPRGDLAWTGAGRAVRLGDVTGDGLADLCEVRAADLRCASGRGDGTFETPVEMPLGVALDPDSLAIGDVDDDGRPDACGRDLDGLACATVDPIARVSLRSPAFDDADATVATSRSLSAIGVEVCGLSVAGVRCVREDASSQIRSTWPAPDAFLWSADLDGDHRVDWCVATDSGPACAVTAVSQDAGGWGFARSGEIENATGLDTTRAALGDVDGDGRADLCVLDEQRIECATSQGHGFGPRSTLAALPFTPSSLWLGDLDGDGRVDACAADDTTIACTR